MQDRLVRRRGARELSDRLGSVRHRARGARHVLHRPPRGGRRASPASSAPRQTSGSSPSTARGPPRWRLHPAPPSAPPHPGCRKDGHEITASHPSPPRRRPRRRASAGRRLPGWMHAQRSGHRRGDEVPVPHASPDHPRQARGVPDLRHEAGANRSGRAPTAAPNTAREGLAPLTIDAAKRQLLGLKTVAVHACAVRDVDSDHGPGRRATSGGSTTSTRAYEGIRRARHGRLHRQVRQRRARSLALLYSPELYATQQEYLLALKASRSLGTSGVSSVAQGGRDLLDCRAPAAPPLGDHAGRHRARSRRTDSRSARCPSMRRSPATSRGARPTTG